MKILLLIISLLLGGVTMAHADETQEPTYTILAQDDAIEVREYAPMITASVTVNGSRREAANKAFGKLADFIFGNNVAPNSDVSQDIVMTAPVIQESSQKIDMTAPVIQENLDQSDQWTVRFVMPASFTMETLPRPNNDEITIEETKPKIIATIRFSGLARQSNLDKHQAALLDWLKTSGYEIAGAPYYAFYDPPWTLPFMRRNEVLVEVKAQ